MPTLTRENSPLVKGFERRKERYRERSLAIKRWYEFYFVEDRYKEDGFLTIATPDSRQAVDLGIYILSRNGHQDRIPRTVQTDPIAQQMSKAERFLAGNWRQVSRLYADRGLAWHQRVLAGWTLMTGWYAQYTAMLPGPDGSPQAIADLWDPANVYPEWGGIDGGLRAVDHEFFYTLADLREMAQRNSWSVPDLSGKDDEVVTVWEHWESRYNPTKPAQPQILQSVQVSAGSTPEEMAPTMQASVPRNGWLPLQELHNRTSDERRGGFLEIPVLVGPAGGVQVSSAYAKSAAQVLAKLGQGLLAPIEEVQLAINRQLSSLLQDIESARVGQSTTVLRSPSGSETMEPDEMGQVQTYRDDTEISYPHAFTPQAGSHELAFRVLGEIFQRLTFAWTGQAPITASGVALQQVHERARAQLGSHHRVMEMLYERTGEIWLRDYRRRWGERQGRIRLRGSVREGDASSLFDEEFSPGDIPETSYLVSEIPWGLVEDDMMKVNIARGLVGPTGQLASFTYAREQVLKIQDTLLEERRIAQDAVTGSAVWQNMGIWEKLREMGDAAADRGDDLGATAMRVAAFQLMRSLTPQQGQGIAPAPSPGFPEAGGLLTNAGGGRPALSPANRPPTPQPQPEARRGGGMLGQAERNR